jgi:ABC-type sulfate/molybdate transport systems ATPase subunit
MPLKNGKSKKVISSNIEELLHDYKQTGTIGTSHPKSMKKSQKQAVAIAYSKAKKK